MSTITKMAGFDPLIAEIEKAKKTKKFSSLLIELEKQIKRFAKDDSLVDLFHVMITINTMVKEGYVENAK